LSQSPFTVLFSSFFSFSIVRYNTFNTFSFVSIKLISQANKRQKSFRKQIVEKLSESFTSRGEGTPSISDDRKRTKPKRQFEYKDATRAKDYANMKRPQQQKPTVRVIPLQIHWKYVSQNDVFNFNFNFIFDMLCLKQSVVSVLVPVKRFNDAVLVTT
jgi:hypothetical protein